MLKKIISFEISFEKINFSENRYKALFAFSLIISNYLIFDYVRTKSSKLISFIDEYLALTSNFGFFTSLDFNAGEFIGGSYSVLLTSGPISSIGGVITWIITENFRISRIGNFYWIIGLQFLFSYFLTKKYDGNFNHLLYFNLLFIFLIPWWQGSLYSIGEIPSMIIFTNAIFLFHKKRNFSLLLISISIVFGKILTFLPFLGFYLFIFLKEKSVKILIKDMLLFFIPVFTWLIFVSFKYENGGLIDYFNDFVSFIFSHPSSGTKGIFMSSLNSLINNSEVMDWNAYDVLRIGLIPLIFCAIILKNKKILDEKFQYFTLPLFGSIFLPYIWFWIFSETKWIRYSQHFTILIILSAIYFLNFTISFDKLSTFLIVLIILNFVENGLIVILSLFLLAYLFYRHSESSNDYLKLLIVSAILLELTSVYFQKNTIANISETVYECEIELMSDNCLTKYLEN